MVDDLRCCGTGTCLINAEGSCWCGQQWDGQKMCFAKPELEPAPLVEASVPKATVQADHLPAAPSTLTVQ